MNLCSLARICGLSNQIKWLGLSRACSQTADLLSLKPQILAREHGFIPRMIREAIEIQKHPNFYREDGWRLSNTWDPQ